jgi:anti-sigma factor RsiW
MSDLREDLKAYLDGELTPERAEAVRLALLQDQDLRQEYEFMKLLTNEIKAGAKDPEVLGEHATVQKVVGRGRAPWKTFATLAFTLVGVGVLAAVLFPVFAQSKEEAKSTANQAASARVMAEAAVPAAPMPQAKSQRAVMDAAKADTAPSSEGTAATDLAPGVVAPPMPSSSVDVPNIARQVVKDGSVEVKVKRVSESVDQVNGMLQKFQGYSESSNQSQQPDGQITASMRVRVPVQNYEALLVSVRQMGDVIAETTNGNDVTGQVMDYDARAKVLQGQKADYEEMLKKARRTSDIMAIKNRIAEIQTQIEQYAAVKKNLDGLARFSSLSITFRQGMPDKFSGTAWIDESSDAGRTVLTGVGTTVGRIGVFLLWLSPIILPLAGMAWWLRRRSAQPAD